MTKNSSGLSQVRQIDNAHRWMPFATTVFLVALISLFIWFFRGGSFRLYASVFFTFYHFTRRIWLSVILIGITQNLVFLPLRFISLKLATSFKNFEDELEKIKSDKEQYFLFTKKVRQGDISILFYIFNFILNAIAFLSAGRIFLIDFYSEKLNPQLLYSSIPYPQYPLQGTDFNFPFLKITTTTALPWSTIFLIWLGLLGLFVIPRLLWRLVKILLGKNKKILFARISYNRLLLKIGGVNGTIFLLSLFILRHIPTSAVGITLIADLTSPNPTMNLITAIGTFITVLHASHTRHRLVGKEAQRNKVPQDIINHVYKQKMRQSLQNAVFLGIGAYVITSQIPSAFELSVATFEVLYILSPYTFDLLLKRSYSATTPTAATPQPQGHHDKTPPLPMVK